jgi:putative flavoprotein involved in K+ transport
MTTTEYVETLVIGGGQAGLAAGYHLAKRRRNFLILEGDDRVGGSWWQRWDSMRLFTPSGRDGLPGMPFPAKHCFPSGAAMGAYLQDYAAHFGLPVRTGVRVDGLFREGRRYLVTAGDRRFEADNVIVASGAHRRPYIPAFATDLAPEIVQLHSLDYRNPGQLRDGDVLVVGAGNSGADISLELVAGRRTCLSGPTPSQIPFRIESRKARVIFPVIWFVWGHVLTLGTPVGRRALPKIAAGQEPLIRVKAKDLTLAGVERTARIAGVVDGLPQTEEGQLLDVANVIWCTGFRSDFSWITLPGIDPTKQLEHVRGAVVDHPGLYVLGQHFQYMFNSHTVGGVGRDAGHVVGQLARRTVQDRDLASVH